MKIKILFLILLIATISNASNKYVQKVGNDGNAGTSWGAGNSYLTVDFGLDQLAAGDTLFVGWGTYTETLTPANNGTSGNELIAIDSARTRYGDVLNLAYPDTLWGVIIDGAANCLNLSGRQFIKFIGIHFTSTTDDAILTTSSTGGGISIIQCKFTDIDRFFMDFQAVTGNTNVIASNLFIADGSDWGGFLLREFCGGTWEIYNNTMYGVMTQFGWYLQGDNDPDINITFKNNLTHNTSATAGDYVIRIVANGGTVYSVDNYDYNLYYGAATNWYEYSGTGGSTLSGWQTSVQLTDADGASNSLNNNPLTKYAATRIIDDTSPAWQTGEVGTYAGIGNMGYWQGDAPEPQAGGTPATKKQIKWRNWN